MKKNRVKIALLALFCVVIAFEVWHLRTAPASARQLPSSVAQKGKPDFALLPTSEIAAFAHFFAEPGLHVEGWEPTVADISGVEANLSQISALSGRHIDNPNQYFRHENDWRKHLVLVYDGGKCFWHATYDASTGKFSNLMVNGVA